jgi:hypothetical protein
MTPAVAKRYAELCEGKAESAFDRKLREKVYPILAWMETNFIKDLIWRVGNRESAH